MRFELNIEKSPFCTVGPYSFTFGQEEHNINVKELPDDFKRQLLYNVNRGVLQSDDKKGLEALAEAMQPTTLVPQEQVPIHRGKVSMIANTLVVDPIKEDLKPLKALLRKTVATVKKEAISYPVSKLRKLLDLEEVNKNRKTVVTFLKERLEQHELSVLAKVGPPEKDNSYKTIERLSTDPNKSMQVSEIEESEDNLITFGEDDIKEDEEGGLLLSLDVLNTLKE